MSTRVRLVLVISADHVALALSARGVVILEDGLATSAQVSLTDVVERLIARAHAERPGGVALDLLLCRPLGERKALFGVPATAALEEVRTRLHDAPHACFLGEEGALVASEPRLIEGRWWAAAVNRVLLESLVDACAPLSIDQCRVIVLDEALATDSLAAPARQAAERPSTDPVSLDPFAGARSDRSRRRRLRLLTGTLLLGLAVSAFGPAAVHATLARREAADIEALQAAGNAAHAWARATAAERLADEARLSRLDTRAPLRTPLISSLGRALPDSAVVMSLTIDSTMATVIILAPPGTDVLQALTRLPHIADPRLQGAVTRERLLDRDVNRTTVAFRLLPPDPKR